MVEKKIKVLFQSRTELFQARGGDTYQIEHTKAAIEKLDPRFEITIDCRTKVPNLKEYDIVNLFNLDFIPETYVQAKYAKEHGIPVVVSAIHHPIHEIEKFDRKCSYGINKIVNSLIPSLSIRNELKNVFRAFKYHAKITPTLLQVFHGERTLQKRVIDYADAVLTQTEQETKELKELFPNNENKFTQVVIGADAKSFINATPELFAEIVGKKNSELKNKRIITCVGRIEPRKNQLNLIKAFQKFSTNYPDFALVFIGEKNNNHKKYFSLFSTACNGNSKIFYLGKQPLDLVASVLSASEICASASWYETLGLTVIEGFLAGAKVLATTKRLNEFIKTGIVFCESDSIKSILSGLIECEKMQKATLQERQKVGEMLDWSNTAKQTVEVYKRLI